VNTQDSGSPTPEIGAARSGIVATLIVLWFTAGDKLSAAAVVLLAVFVSVPIAAAAGIAFFSLVEFTCCVWIDENWAQWEAKVSDKIRAKVERWREGRMLRHIVGWISGGSALMYIIAAVLTSPITTVTVARLIGGKTVGKSRILTACVAYSVFLVGIATIVALMFLEGEQAV
jgi:hypothetical protein